MARARTAEATARGHQLSLDLEVDEPPPDHAAYHTDSYSSVGGLGAGHNEVAWRSANQPKVGLPGKAPWYVLLLAQRVHSEVCCVIV